MPETNGKVREFRGVGQLHIERKGVAKDSINHTCIVTPLKSSGYQDTLSWSVFFCCDETS